MSCFNTRSTLKVWDSQLLTVASTLTHDLLPYFDTELTDAERVRADRIAVISVRVFTNAVAALFPDIAALLSGLGTFFAIIGVAVIATVFWDATTDRAVFSGLGVGLIAAGGVVLVTGTARVAPVVDLDVTGVTVLLLSILARHELLEALDLS